jgi:hypothetical protein
VARLDSWKEYFGRFVDLLHPDLAANLVPGWNFVDDTPNVSDDFGQTFVHVGKVTHPCGAPDNHLLTVWTPGPGPVGEPMKIAGGAIESGAISLRPVLFHILIRVEPAIERQHPHVQAFVERGGQAIFLPPLSISQGSISQGSTGDGELFGVGWQAWVEEPEEIPVEKWRGDQDRSRAAPEQEALDCRG